MGWTTGKTLAQMTTTLVAAGALTDQAQTALMALAFTPNVPLMLWGILVQCTAGWMSGAPAFEYDSTPSTTAGQTLSQMVTTLVTAGARSEQATHVLHGLAWKPGVPGTFWGVLVECTSGWNAGAPVYEYNSTPS